MDVTVKFYEMEFKGKTGKEAYLKACKWLAKYIIGKVEAGSNITYSIEKAKETSYPTIILTLYCSIKSSVIEKDFCEACQQFHRSFFINDEFNCTSCKMQAYFAQAQQKLLVKKQYRKERLEYLLNK